MRILYWVRRRTTVILENTEVLLLLSRIACITRTRIVFIAATRKLIEARIKNDSHAVIYRPFRIKQISRISYPPVFSGITAVSSGDLNKGRYSKLWLKVRYKYSSFEPYKKEAHHVWSVIYGAVPMSEKEHMNYSLILKWIFRWMN